MEDIKENMATQQHLEDETAQLLEKAYATNASISANDAASGKPKETFAKPLPVQPAEKAHNGFEEMPASLQDICGGPLPLELACTTTFSMFPEPSHFDGFVIGQCS